ncbi:inactive pancreatic lipase-related protein 1-like [Gastrophryne carolinensis]
MIGSLEDKYQYNLYKLTLIGYNLGCHIAGQAGKINKKIGFIVALDPTVLMFDGLEQLHVAKGDAFYVIVFHTDTKPLNELGFGFRSPLGDIDIYINGGRYMPECQPPTIPMEEVMCLFNLVLGPLGCNESYPTPAQCAEIMGDRKYTEQDILALDFQAFCDHYQALNYYIDSIMNSSKYIGRPCKTVEDCEAGVTEPCPEHEECPQVGHGAYPPLCENCDCQLFYVEAIAEPVLDS